jgi:hypothetical protein
VDRPWQQNESDATDEDRNEQTDRVRGELACRRLGGVRAVQDERAVTPASIAPIPPGTRIT